MLTPENLQARLEEGYEIVQRGRVLRPSVLGSDETFADRVEGCRVSEIRGGDALLQNDEEWVHLRKKTTGASDIQNVSGKEQAMIEDLIDGVLIDQDENGFALILSGQKAEYRLNVHGVAHELLAAAEREIGPWRAKLHDAATQLMGGDADAAAYALRDPKHPSHHDAMSTLEDGRDDAA